MEENTTLENFGEKKLHNLFADSDNPRIIKVGDLIAKKASIEEIVHAAKIAAEQRQIVTEEGKDE